MEQGTQHPLEIYKQANQSIILIAGILIMTAIYMTCTYNTEDETFVLYTLACPIFTLLLGMYTFSYRGKAHLISRIIFFISLAISIFSVFILCYFIAIGNAYAH